MFDLSHYEMPAFPSSEAAISDIEKTIACRHISEIIVPRESCKYSDSALGKAASDAADRPHLLQSLGEKAGQL